MKWGVTRCNVLCAACNNLVVMHAHRGFKTKTARLAAKEVLRTAMLKKVVAKSRTQFFFLQCLQQLVSMILTIAGGVTR